MEKWSRPIHNSRKEEAIFLSEITMPKDDVMPIDRTTLFTELRKLSPKVTGGCYGCAGRRIAMRPSSSSTSCSRRWPSPSRFGASRASEPTSGWLTRRVSPNRNWSSFLWSR